MAAREVGVNKWADILGLSGLGAWELDKIKKQIRFSDAGKQLLGLKFNEFLTIEAFSAMFKPPFDLSLRDCFFALMTQDQSFNQKALSLNGNWIRIKGMVSRKNVTPWYIGNFEVLMDLEEVIDLTFGRQYHFLFKENPMPMFIWEFKTLNILDCNRQALLKYGYTREEFLKLNIRDIRPKEDIPLIEQVATSEEEYGEIHQRVWRHKTKSGAVIFVEITGHLVEIEGRRCSMVLINDITEKKKAEEALKKERSLLRAIIDNLPIQIYVKDLDGRHIINNKFQYENLLGAQSENETLGKTVFDFFPYEIALRMNSYDRLIIQNGAPVLNLEEYYFDQGGEKIWLLTNKVPLKNVEGEVVGLVGMSRDVTESKKKEENLRKLNKELESQAKELEVSNQELEQFAYIASHDLQEPLRMITGFLGLLEKKYYPILDERGKQYIFFAVDGAHRMKEIIMNLLAYSRAGQKEEKVKDVNVGEVVSNVLKLNNGLILKNQVKIRVATLPTIRIPVSPLHQLFQNLISNALKYHFPGKIPLIDVGLKEDEYDWCFFVRDNGIGVPADKKDQVFVLFSRLHRKEDYEGSGIGLAMCKKILDNLGGRIWFTSEEGQGSTFYFTVPKIFAEDGLSIIKE